MLFPLRLSGLTLPAWRFYNNKCAYFLRALPAAVYFLVMIMIIVLFGIHVSSYLPYKALQDKLQVIESVDSLKKRPFILVAVAMVASVTIALVAIVH